MVGLLAFDICAGLQAATLVMQSVVAFGQHSITYREMDYAEFRSQFAGYKASNIQES